MNDSIAEMITKIKNGSDAQKTSVVFPFSKIKWAISEILLKEGYIKAFSKKGKKISKFIEIELLYGANRPGIKGVKRTSHLSKRIYQAKKDVKSVKYGQGTLVLSTSKGILSDSEARKQNIGGEALFKIW